MKNMTDNYNIGEDTYYYNNEKSEEEVQKKYNKLVKISAELEMPVATIESCTAGYVGQLIKKAENNAKNQSENLKSIYKGTNVVYSNVAKNSAGVCEKITNKYTVYSSITAGTMAKVARNNFKLNDGITLATTGTAGTKDGANWSSEPGEVYIAINSNNYNHKRKIYLNAKLGKTKAKIVIADAITNLYAEALLANIASRKDKLKYKNLYEELKNIVEIPTKNDKDKETYLKKYKESMDEWKESKKNDIIDAKNKYNIPKIKEFIKKNNKIVLKNAPIISKECEDISTLNLKQKMSFKELFIEDNKEPEKFDINDTLQNIITIAHKYKIKIFGIEVLDKKEQIYTNTVTNKSNSSSFLLGADVYNDVELFKKHYLNNEEINSNTIKSVTKLAQKKCENFSNIDVDMGYSIIEDKKNNKVFVAVYSKETKQVKLKEIEINEKNSKVLEEEINKELEKLMQTQIIEIANKKRNLQKFSVNKDKLKKIDRTIEAFIKHSSPYNNKIKNIGKTVKKTLKTILFEKKNLPNNTNSLLRY